ncbi:MAG: hypothetical protein EAY65_06645 [Alphaproteobacteria bacterium]|nr:MAG: hypothetical protein EAY65_06645 [Alphaproteobacteria bacterium]
MTSPNNRTICSPIRLVALWLLMCSMMVITCATPSFAATRHAVLMYDADTKKVLYHEHGYAQRYPASLTKMMTLYMLFEQMRMGRVRLSTSMNVSRYAASQPQTNISLRAGERITVEQAIKALVVRSANDVAVVVAEHIGGSESKFAQMATNKARQLGMKNTIYKNPHGLPNGRQVTTAMDMALLGAALRRDFPQYYHYFTTRKFSYRGRHYTSHNRVLNRLQGVDGIKTGYINASGFNLVSSYRRNGVNLVGVVMGGNSAVERDNRMVKMLSQTSTRLAAERGGRSIVPNEPPIAYAPHAASFFAPKPLFKPQPSNALGQASAPPIPAPHTPMQAMVAPPTAQPPIRISPRKERNMLERLITQVLGGAEPQPQQPSGEIHVDLSNDAARAAKNSFGLSLDLEEPRTTPPEIWTPQRIVSVPIIEPTAPKTTTAPPKNTLDYQFATLNHDQPIPAPLPIQEGKEWAVQIGVFPDNTSAQQALAETMRTLGVSATNASPSVEYAQNATSHFHRARLKNLTHPEAVQLCTSLSSKGRDCFVVRSD